MKHKRQKRRADRQIGHTQDRIMTYADMITLLLCFFAIFLCVTIPKKDATSKVHIPEIAERLAPRQVKPEGDKQAEQIVDPNATATVPAQDPSYIPDHKFFAAKLGLMDK